MPSRANAVVVADFPSGFSDLAAKRLLLQLQTEPKA